MRVNIKATEITLIDSLRGYLDKKLKSLRKLINLDDPAVMIDVEVGRTTRHHHSGEIFFAEMNIHRGKESFRAVSYGENLHAAIDEMHDAIARELTSHKGKKLSVLRRGGLLAKALLRGGYDGLRYLERPTRAGWRYVKKLRWWRR